METRWCRLCGNPFTPTNSQQAHCTVSGWLNEEHVPTVALLAQALDGENVDMWAYVKRVEGAEEPPRAKPKAAAPRSPRARERDGRVAEIRAAMAECRENGIEPTRAAVQEIVGDSLDVAAIADGLHRDGQEDGCGDWLTAIGGVDEGE